MTPRPPAGPAHTARAVPARLERAGRLAWAEARTLLTGTTCAWADLDGFHIAPADRLPEQPLHATHLWAWDARRCLRLRIDGPHALTALLTPGQDGGEQVRIHIRPGTPWAKDDQQAGPLPAEAHALNFELLELPGPTPATFVRATAP
ncbi:MULTISPECIES: hypothetical protein [unclassified Streptomyces]|uniref:hypothetical protein n=1 Tax=unclassified Streptomyces TaxID=2593676 RepID=UPI00224E3F9C|nr:MULTISPECIES: hypothetical protein [unclassified Streptomyces]MCX5054663.1 hypothetical protein [Streptomyces sp. NBC_00474]